MFSIPKYIA